jgi:hypothetical protein
VFSVSIAVFFGVLLAPSVGAQEYRRGSVRLVIRNHHLPALGLAPDSQAISWMTPSSMEEAERLAAMWAAGDDDEALRIWRAVVQTEVAAERLATYAQVDGAATWIAARAMAIASSESQDSRDDTPERREREIRWAVRSAARVLINGPG